MEKRKTNWSLWTGFPVALIETFRGPISCFSGLRRYCLPRGCDARSARASFYRGKNLGTVLHVRE
jgi:hypothetical protein